MSAITCDNCVARCARRPLTTVLLACCALASVAPAASAALPGAGLLSPVAAVPGNINSADLNADGRPDIVAPEFGTDFLAVRINTGNGTFGPITRYVVGLKPSFITRGDFNGDHEADIAVSNAGSSFVSVLLGNGDGTLRATHNYPISGPTAGLLDLISIGSFSLETADVDGDGVLDLVTSNSVSNDVSVLPGRGDGTFAGAHTYSIAGTSSIGGIPFALSLADFDADGDPDIITGGALTDAVLLNDGHGRFKSTTSNPVGVINSCTKIGDVDSDGVPDAVATTWGASNAQVLLGNGDGSFRNGDNLSSGGLVAECFTLADVNADRHLDLAIANTSSVVGTGVVEVLLGDGHGHFAHAAVYPVNAAAWATAVADYDSDGIVDIVVADSLPPTFSLLRGNGDGSFRQQISFPL
jgi:hypothetical protein